MYRINFEKTDGSLCKKFSQKEKNFVDCGCQQAQTRRESLAKIAQKNIFNWQDLRAVALFEILRTFSE